MFRVCNFLHLAFLMHFRAVMWFFASFTQYVHSYSFFKRGMFMLPIISIDSMPLPQQESSSNCVNSICSIYLRSWCWFWLAHRDLTFHSLMKGQYFLTSRLSHPPLAIWEIVYIAPIPSHIVCSVILHHFTSIHGTLVSGLRPIHKIL